MVDRIDKNHSLEDLFGGLVEQVFMAEIGICDPTLTSYLTNLLIDFVHTDKIYRLQTADGEALRDLAAIEAGVVLPEKCDGTERTRLINRYVGDFALFWTGVYPETLRPRRRHGADRLREYMLRGKQSYSIASELTLGSTKPPGELLAHLSEQFECCVHGLHRVRESWEELGNN
ncbi:MAG: hypothetical protein AB7N71_07955 [Phycisphaerae bacterium]